MLKEAKGFIAGVLVCAAATGTVAFSKTAKETITAAYNNIKIIVDGILVETKDVNGNSVEPFIYNGTTYLPVRAVGEALGKTVSWDGETQTVYLGEKPGDKQYLMDICPPYDDDGKGQYKAYKSEENKHFVMGGKKYTNGFTTSAYYGDDGFVLINLNGEYSKLEFDVGHVDDEVMNDTTLVIYKDGERFGEYDLVADALPQRVSLPVKGCLQVKFVVTSLGGNNADWGFGDIVVE